MLHNLPIDKSGFHKLKQLIMTEATPQREREGSLEIVRGRNEDLCYNVNTVAVCAISVVT